MEIQVIWILVPNSRFCNSKILNNCLNFSESESVNPYT